MTARTDSADLSIALNRFGLGARGDETEPADARAFLIDQMDAYDTAPAGFGATRRSADIVAEYGEDREDIRAMDAGSRMAARTKLRKRGGVVHRDEIGMRVARSLETPAPFVERLVHFWSNHFAISADKPQVTVLAGSFEREAIRPHVLGSFQSMLFAVETHPAMQFYLDQVGSVGPNSQRARHAAKRRRRKIPGINENLAREIMELHTLGVRTGYSQQDVTEFALALTGWSVAGLRDDDPGNFIFRPQWHEPGARGILGRTYRQDGQGQARAVLSDLAAAEATATHIATKLARHFIADDPPAGAVEKLKASFLRTNGDLPALYRTLVGMEEAWKPEPRKFKSPWEWTISALRGLGRSDLGEKESVRLFNQLGQPVWRPGSPAGYDDSMQRWAAPDALVRRVEISRMLARSAPQLDARELAPRLLSGSLSERTRVQISRAETSRAGLALLLVSPEFQRR